MSKKQLIFLACLFLPAILGSAVVVATLIYVGEAAVSDTARSPFGWYCDRMCDRLTLAEKQDYALCPKEQRPDLRTGGCGCCRLRIHNDE